MNRYDQDLQDLIGFVKQYGTLRENEVTMFMRSINHNMKAGFPRSTVFENPEWEKLLAGVIDYMKVNSELFENLIDKIKTQPFTHDLALSNMVFYVRPLTIEERTKAWFYTSNYKHSHLY